MTTVTIILRHANGISVIVVKRPADKVVGTNLTHVAQLGLLVWIFLPSSVRRFLLIVSLSLRTCWEMVNAMRVLTTQRLVRGILVIVVWKPVDKAAGTNHTHVVLLGSNAWIQV